jgi:hypothetical protein
MTKLCAQSFEPVLGQNLSSQKALHSIPYRTMYSVLTSIINIILEMFPLTGNIGPLDPTQHVVGIFVPSTSGVSNVYLTLWAYCTDSTDRWKHKPISVLEMETRFRFRLSRNGNGYVFLYRFKRSPHTLSHIDLSSDLSVE